MVGWKKVIMLPGEKEFARSHAVETWLWKWLCRQGEELQGYDTDMRGGKTEKA